MELIAEFILKAWTSCPMFQRSKLLSILSKTFKNFNCTNKYCYFFVSNNVFKLMA